MSFWKTLTGGGVAERTPEPRSRAGKAGSRDDSGWRTRLQDGYIWSERHMIMPRPCSIREMSPLTATIQLWHDDIKASSLRGTLKFYNSADRKEAPCIVVHREGRMLKLKFEGPFRPATRRYE